MELKVLKDTKKNGQETYSLQVYDENGNVVEMPPNTARPFTRKEFEQFVENGGEEALCVACETREKIKSDITKIQSDSNLSLSQKQAAIKAKQDQILRADSNWKTQLDEMVGESGFSNKQIDDALKEVQPLPRHDIQPSEKFGKEGTDPTGDSDGDGIPDLEDNDPYQTPEQIKTESEKAAAIKGLQGHHATMSDSDYESLKKNKFYIPGTVKDEDKYIPTFKSRTDDVIYKGKNNTWIVPTQKHTNDTQKHIYEREGKILQTGRTLPDITS